MRLFNGVLTAFEPGVILKALVTSSGKPFRIGKPAMGGKRILLQWMHGPVFLL